MNVVGTVSAVSALCKTYVYCFYGTPPPGNHCGSESNPLNSTYLPIKTHITVCKAMNPQSKGIKGDRGKKTKWRIHIWLPNVYNNSSCLTAGVPESTLSFDLEPLVTFYEDDILPAQIPKHFCLKESF